MKVEFSERWELTDERGERSVLAQVGSPEVYTADDKILFEGETLRALELVRRLKYRRVGSGGLVDEGMFRSLIERFSGAPTEEFY